MKNTPPEYRPDSEYQTSGLDLREYLRVLFNYKSGIVGLAIIAGLLGLYAAYKVTPIYRSSATLQIEREATPALGSAYLYPIQNWEFYQTQYQLLRSWGVAELAAEDLGLFDAMDSAAQPAAAAKSSFLNWRRLIPDALGKPPREIGPEERRNNIIAGVQAAITVNPVENSELVSISVDNPDPQRAADTANAVAKSYINFLKDRALADITNNQSWYVSRLDQAKADLEDAESKYQAFLDKEGILTDAEGADAVRTQRLQLAMSGREQARLDRLAVESLYRQIQSVRSGGAGSLETITELESRGIVRELKSNVGQARQQVNELSLRYGPKHRRMIAANSQLETDRQLYQEELDKAADSVVADFERARQAELSFSDQLAEAETDLRQLNRQQAELTRLQDGVKSARALFDQLQSGERTAGLLEGGEQKVNAGVIEAARPGLSPVRPNKQRMVLAWAFSGLALGVALAFLLDHLDNTFKGSEDVERRLALPVLGLLPQLKLNKSETLAPMSQFTEKSRSAFSEAVRTVRTGVMLSTLDNEQSVIVVTSSVPGEGKTTLAINLAHSIGQMKRTVLIDADMRRPMVHKAKSIEKVHPGLSSLIAGEVSLEQVIDRQQGEELHIIHAGVIPPNPLELLSSKRFKDLIKHLKSLYDVVVIDSTPTLAVSDALVVSQLADAVLYVIRADATPYQAAEQGAKRLRRADVPLLGVVLNQVAASGKGYYGKYRKYGRYYRYGRYGYYGDQYHEYYGVNEKAS